VVADADVAGLAGHLWQFLQRLAEPFAQQRHVDPGLRQQRLGAAAGLVDQRGHQVGGFDHAVVAPDRERLRVGQGLLEAGSELVHPHGGFLDISGGPGRNVPEMRPRPAAFKLGRAGGQCPPDAYTRLFTIASWFRPPTCPRLRRSPMTGPCSWMSTAPCWSSPPPPKACRCRGGWSRAWRACNGTWAARSGWSAVAASPSWTNCSRRCACPPPGCTGWSAVTPTTMSTRQPRRRC